MTSLPKRGDRVRVTAVPECCPTRKHYLGEEYVLANDAVMHPIHPGYCAFSPEPEGWVSPVKVEILERANSCPTCRDTPVFDARCPCPTCGPTGTPEILERALPAELYATIAASDDETRAAELRAEFARGMRRAVRIAEGLPFPLSYRYLLLELSEAVEKELKS